MSVLTLFSAPKAFTDPRIRMIQENAIASWCRLPDVEVMLMGQESGLTDVARRLGVRHIPEVERNSSGTPLVSSMIGLAREGSRSPLLGIINADMIVMRDMVVAVRTMMHLRARFVLLSRRWDLQVDEPIQFGEEWEECLRRAARERGVLHRPAGSDLFVFPRSCYSDLPAFAIGRAGWDNWMIYNARREHWPVVDATPSLTLIHQSHDYRHLPGGSPHYAMPESDENIRLAGGEAAIRYTIVDATHTLSAGRLIHPRMSYLRFMRSAELFLRAVFFFLPASAVEQVARPKRWKKRLLRLLGIAPAPK